MIIELFGPPGAGKTTFARALVAQLQRHGHPAELFGRYRPAEQLSHPGSCAAAPPRHSTVAVVRRLTRPLVEMLTLLRHPLENSRDIETAANLMTMLPPKNLIWSIRMRQYISRFSHSWYQVSAADHIVLFDQAYVQVVCSLAILSGVKDETILARALDVAPKADLLIRLSAPPDVLKTRLNERSSQQGRIERLFEFDLKRNLQSIEIIERLHNMLRRNGRPVICARSLDSHSLHESSERIAQQLLEKFPTQYVESRIMAASRWRYA